MCTYVLALFKDEWYIFNDDYCINMIMLIIVSTHNSTSKLSILLLIIVLFKSGVVFNGNSNFQIIALALSI